MMLWVALSLLLVLAALGLLWPFLRRAPKDGAGVQSIEMFKGQLAEIKGELARGAISEAEARETRLEIERRLIAAAKRKDGAAMAEMSGRGRTVAVLVTMAWLVVGSVALYATTGRPELVRAPVAAPLVAATPSGAALLPGNEAQAAAPAPEAEQLGDVDTMIARLAARLEAAPDDPAGWQMLGWSYLSTGNAPAAARAYERAVSLAPGDAELLSLLAEASVRAEGGVVTPEAGEILRRSLAADPENPRARFFEGLALAQSGDRQGALDAWTALLRDAPPDADWRPGLVERIREAAAAMGVAVDLPDTVPSPAATPPVGPTAADVAAAQGMTLEDRQAMIRGMVEGLAARLATQPDDAQGWAQLVRSYGVLGERESQADALADARAALAMDPGGLILVETAARETGLN